MYYPMLAKQANVTDLGPYLTDSGWWMQQKLDGHRVMLVGGGPDAPPSTLTRNGTPYTRGLPAALRDVRLPGRPGQWVLDGELVGDVFYAFDVPITRDTNMNYQLIDRYPELVSAVRWIGHKNVRLVPMARFQEDKVRLAETALREGYEGLVLKRRHSQYVNGGRTDDWLKVKFVATVDCVVLGVRDDGKDSVRLGLHGPSSGAFGTGVKSRDVKLHDVGRASLIGKEKNGTIAVGDVIEVRYLYVGAGNRLYQPTILKKRTDKKPEECTTGQLRYVNKKVLEVL